MKNKIFSRKNIAIGKDCNTKINVLLGFNHKSEIEKEYEKLTILKNSEYGIDIITDLSILQMSTNETIWKKVITDTNFMAATVPIYQARQENGLVDSELLLNNINEQCSEGVSIITIHPTPTNELFNMSKNRIIPLTSRGGGIVLNDLILSNKIENVYIRIFDDILKTAKNYGTIISIGSSFRSATIADGNDNVYQKELDIQLDLAKYISEFGIGTIIETPGHVSPRDIASICAKLKLFPYPVMPLGPIPTDIAKSQDDLAAVVGAVLMGTQDCADILSIVTRDEHMGGIPDIASLLSAIEKYEIAKHIIDLHKISDITLDISIARKRSSLHSCVDCATGFCERCGNMCPLKF